MIPGFVNQNGNQFKVLGKEGALYRVSPIDEYVVLHTGAIARNTEKLITLNSVGITDDLQLISIWNNSPSTILTKAFDLRVVLPGNDEFFKISVTDLNHPFTFPFVVVRPNWQLGFKPTEATTDIIIYTRMAYITSDVQL